MKRLSFFLAAAAVCVECGAAAHSSCFYDAVDLSGAWEMAYRKKPVAGEALPEFAGEVVERAVPAYWEDLPQFAKFALPFKPETFPMRKRTHTLIPGQIRGTFLYRRTVDLDRAGDAVLAFELVRNNVSVWANGRFVGRHSGFLAPFEMPVPAGALLKGKNEIVMAIDNEGAPGLPGRNCAGGTTSRAIFMNTGGIDGRLELRFLKSGICDVYVTTAEDLKSFTVHASGWERFDWRILDGGKCLKSGNAPGDFTVSAEGFEFWSPESPKRYDLEMTAAGGAVYRAKFGIRRLVAKGERLFLNGEPVYLRGVTDHCYYAKTMHLPMDADYYRMVVRKRKECGFNYVRFHTYVPPEAFFEAMDELGYLAHVETAHNPSVETFAEVVALARRHPSAVIYCAGNEDGLHSALEAALPRYATTVHAMSDGLFSPVCAMRNAEYSFNNKGKEQRHYNDKVDVVVPEPFPHCADRLRHYATFSDLFTSMIHGGYMSYDSLDGTPAQVDGVSDVYFGKPRLTHEMCIDGTYVDFSTERLYPPDSPFLKTGIFDGIRRQLAKKGLLGRADLYFRNSCEWQRRIRKHCFEKQRACRRLQGFDFLGDINTHWHTCGYSCGIFDEFYRMKPGETAENVRRYNSAAVLLCDLGNDFSFRCGETRRVGFALSNFDVPAASGTLRVALEDGSGSVVSSAELPVGAMPKGEVADVAAWDVRFPAGDAPRAYLLRATLSAGALKAENVWEAYAFPEPPKARAGGAKVTVLGDCSKERLLKELAAGGRVVLFAENGKPFNSQKTSFRIGLPGRSAGNYATVIRRHPVFDGFPHDGYCGWQFRRAMEDGRAIQLEADVPFDPIVDVASSVKVVIRQAMMFEYSVGPGRLLVCGFRLRGQDPACAYLKGRILEYAAGDGFSPSDRISPAQLAAVIDAPIVTGSKDTNRANDTNAN